MSVEARRHRAVFWVVFAALVLMAALGLIVGLLPPQLLRGKLVLIAPRPSPYPDDPWGFLKLW